VIGDLLPRRLLLGAEHLLGLRGRPHLAIFRRLPRSSVGLGLRLRDLGLRRGDFPCRPRDVALRLHRLPARRPVCGRDRSGDLLIETDDLLGSLVLLLNLFMDRGDCSVESLLIGRIPRGEILPVDLMPFLCAECIRVEDVLPVCSVLGRALLIEGSLLELPLRKSVLESAKLRGRRLLLGLRLRASGLLRLASLPLLILDVPLRLIVLSLPLFQSGDFDR